VATPVTTVLDLAGASIRLHDDGFTTTVYPDGKHVVACAEDTDAYRQTALEHGYGEDVDKLSREHEVCHALLAAWLGLPHSPALRAVALGRPQDGDWREEAAVLAVQRWARACGVDLVAVAQGMGARD
jgi:hypothetical protein